MAAPVWHGTVREAALLVQAIMRNCTCVYDMTGARTSTCSPHEAMVRDQRFSDGLLFARRMADLWRQGEFNVASEWWERG